MCAYAIMESDYLNFDVATQTCMRLAVDCYALEKPGLWLLRENEAVITTVRP
jgi:hypothetical protein